MKTTALCFLLCILLPMQSFTQTNDLQISLRKKGDHEVCVTVKNTGKSTITVMSHVVTHELHYDNFEIDVLTPDHDEFSLSFTDARDKSYPVYADLAPGESFSHTLNLDDWALRSINLHDLQQAGFNYMPHGVRIRAWYRNSSNDVHKGKQVWTGAIQSDWIDF